MDFTQAFNEFHPVTNEQRHNDIQEDKRSWPAGGKGSTHTAVGTDGLTWPGQGAAGARSQHPPAAPGCCSTAPVSCCGFSAKPGSRLRCSLDALIGFS